MKRFIVLAAGSLALLAGNAYAEGCAYGQKAAMAAAHHAVEEPIAEQASSEELMARLRKQEEALQQALVVPNVHN